MPTLTGYNFIFPHTADFYRPDTLVAAPGVNVGDRGYSAMRGQPIALAGPGVLNSATVLFLAVQCSIQLSGAGKSPAGVPSDPGRASAKILIGDVVQIIPRGAFRSGDFCIDDEGRTWTISNAYWSPMGWSMSATEKTV